MLTYSNVFDVLLVLAAWLGSYECQDARVHMGSVPVRGCNRGTGSAAHVAAGGVLMNWWIKVLLLAGVFTLPIWPAVNAIATLEGDTQLGCITDYECEVLGDD